MMQRAVRALRLVDSAALLGRLRRNQWCPYQYWCMAVLLLLPAPACPPRSGSQAAGASGVTMRRDLLLDPHVISEKRAFITAVRCP